ncbi:outer mitochondrial transmembrane helix translocase isoform X1 [Stigmatopora argus]
MVLRELPTEHAARSLGRNEVLGLLFRLTVFGAVTYFTVKWMVDAVDPTRKQKVEAQKQAEKLMRRIGVKDVKLSEYEMSIAAHLVDPLAMQMSWRDIGGLDDVIAELQETVIMPVQKRHLFQSSKLLQPPKGVLLYGPPGCGKTLIAKATAKEAGFRFINLQPSTLTDKWYGESQKLAAAVFSLAVKLQPAVVFIDEIDSFLRNRSSSDHEATAMMKAQFMSLWDGLDTDHRCQVIVMGATNRPQDLDSAILRRMPARFHIKQPSLHQRQQILKLILENENVSQRSGLLLLLLSFLSLPFHSFWLPAGGAVGGAFGAGPGNGRLFGERPSGDVPRRRPLQRPGLCSQRRRRGGPGFHPSHRRFRPSAGCGQDEEVQGGGGARRSIARRSGLRTPPPPVTLLGFSRKDSSYFCPLLLIK